MSPKEKKKNEKKNKNTNPDAMDTEKSRLQGKSPDEIPYFPPEGEDSKN